MDYRAEKAGINVSALLQEAIAKELNLPASRKKRDKQYNAGTAQPMAMR
jgi:post-segregation antitoxin (ccd killing protein)